VIKLAIVDDDREVLETLSLYLGGSPQFQSVRTAGSVEEFIELLDSGYQPDIVLQDVQLPGKSGLDAILIYRNRIPDAKILMNSVLQDSETVFGAICAGALGYIEKGASLEKIREAILSLHSGGSPLSPSLARHVINFFNPAKKFEQELSPREREIVQGILDGLSYKLIAERLSIGIDTVRTHVTRVYRKLQINSKGELMMKYLKR
jgi:DNA-binding NarL/FixJ family response regulator